MAYTMRIKDLHRRALMWRVTPEQARGRIQDVLDLITSLLTESSDAKRLRTIRKISRLLVLGYNTIEDLAIASAIANQSPALQAKIRRAQQEKR